MTNAAWLASGRLRARRDLHLSMNGEATVVKDPLSLEYFRIGDRERFLLETLAEPLTINELTNRYQRRFPNERSTGAQVLAFCASLYECALLLSDQPLTSQQEDRRRQPRTPWYTALLSPLAIRLPGIDPTPLLKRLDSFATIVFSRGFALLLLIAFLLTGIGLVGQAELLSTELARLTDLMVPAYAVMAILAVLLTKTWHELGHALACRRMGTECHEVGVMLLALFPCLYCDVSDAWTLRSRWQRAVVALAGVYFEVLLAVSAAATWLVLAPGPLRILSLYVVVTASLSTVLVNLNPLIRFDGYYVLADLWGVANLHEQSRSALWGPLHRWIRGDSSFAEPRDASPLLLAAYGLASTLYGWCLLATILWFTYQALDAVGFAAVGDLLVAVTLGGVVAVAARSTLGLVPRGPGGRSLGATARFAFVVAAVVAGVAWIASWPLEQTLYARCRFESVSLVEVVARSEGTLESRVRYGDQVEAGDLLAELIDPDAELRRLELLEREAALVTEREGLRTRSQSDSALLAEIARLEPTLAEVRQQLRAHDAQTTSRRLRAPIGGRVERSSDRGNAPQEETAEGDLPTWGGAPLDPANDRCTLAEGETLCRIVGEKLRAVLLLSEDDSGLVQIGNPVRIVMDRVPSKVLPAKVRDISLAAVDMNLSEAEQKLEATLRGPLDEGAVYRVSVSLIEGEPDSALPEPAPEAQPGAIGQARIITGEETVAGRIARWIRRLFRWG